MLASFAMLNEEYALIVRTQNDYRDSSGRQMLLSRSDSSSGQTSCSGFPARLLTARGYEHDCTLILRKCL